MANYNDQQNNQNEQGGLSQILDTAEGLYDKYEQYKGLRDKISGKGDSGASGGESQAGVSGNNTSLSGGDNSTSNFSANNSDDISFSSLKDQNASNFADISGTTSDVQASALTGDSAISGGIGEVAASASGKAAEIGGELATSAAGGATAAGAEAAAEAAAGAAEAGAETGATVAAEGAASSTGVGAIVVAAFEAAKALVAVEEGAVSSVTGVKVTISDYFIYFIVIIGLSFMFLSAMFTGAFNLFFSMIPEKASHTYEAQYNYEERIGYDAGDVNKVKAPYSVTDNLLAHTFDIKEVDNANFFASTFISYENQQLNGLAYEIEAGFLDKILVRKIMESVSSILFRRDVKEDKFFEEPEVLGPLNQKYTFLKGLQDYREYVEEGFRNSYKLAHDWVLYNRILPGIAKWEPIPNHWYDPERTWDSFWSNDNPNQPDEEKYRHAGVRYGDEFFEIIDFKLLFCIVSQGDKYDHWNEDWPGGELNIDQNYIDLFKDMNSKVNSGIEGTKKLIYMHKIKTEEMEEVIHHSVTNEDGSIDSWDEHIHWHEITLVPCDQKHLFAMVDLEPNEINRHFLNKNGEIPNPDCPDKAFPPTCIDNLETMLLYIDNFAKYDDYGLFDFGTEEGYPKRDVFEYPEWESEDLNEPIAFSDYQDLLDELLKKYYERAQEAIDIEALLNGMTLTDLQKMLLEFALKQIGLLYDQGKRNQEGYYDCSSLVAAIYRSIGVQFGSYSPVAGEMCRWLETNGYEISRGYTPNLQVGDVIFYSGNAERYRGVGHVAFYAGNGMIIDASSSKGKVVYRKIWGKNKIISICRPLKSSSKQ